MHQENKQMVHADFGESNKLQTKIIQSCQSNLSSIQRRQLPIK
jgi:hypothetical protein